MVKKRTDAILVVMCDPSGWQWGLALEYINSEINCGRECKVLDLSFLGELRAKTTLKIIFGGFKVRKEGLKYLRSKDVEVNVVYTKFFPRKRKDLINSDLFSNVSINSIVEMSGILDADLRSRNKQSNKISKYENKKRDRTLRVITDFGLGDYLKVVVVNGRFTKSATLKRYCALSGIDCELIEGGGKANSFEVFNEGPHSVKEVTYKMKNFWEQGTEPARSEIAKRYLQDLVKNKSFPGLDFRKSMVEGKLPELSNKKICVFFASSEWEYVGIGDPIESNSFKNQVEAFDCLIQELDRNLWDVYLRLHPSRPGEDLSASEEVVWKKFYDDKRLIVVESDSNIDSLALGHKADLIASFGSSINTEFIARGFQNVVTLGPAIWNSLIPERYCPSSTTLRSYLVTQQKLVSINQLYPWAYFRSESGKPFQIISTDSRTGVWKLNYAENS